MKNAKLIALATSFNKAPEPVKKAAEDLKAAYLRAEKAEAQFQLWNEERQAARKIMDRENRQFTNVLKAWDPAGTKSGELEELP